MHQGKPKTEPTIFYNLISKVAYHHFLPYSISHADQSWYNVEENYKIINNRRWVSLEVILKAGYYTNSFSLKCVVLECVQQPYIYC